MIITHTYTVVGTADHGRGEHIQLATFLTLKHAENWVAQHRSAQYPAYLTVDMPHLGNVTFWEILVAEAQC